MDLHVEVTHAKGHLMNPLLEPSHEGKKEGGKERGKQRERREKKRMGGYFSEYAILPSYKIHNLGQRFAPEKDSGHGVCRSRSHLFNHWPGM